MKAKRSGVYKNLGQILKIYFASVLHGPTECSLMWSYASLRLFSFQKTAMSGYQISVHNHLDFVCLSALLMV